MFLNVCFIIGLFLLAGVVGFYVRLRLSLRRAARSVLWAQQQMYGQLHDFRRADPADYPHADLAYYEQLHAELARLGFRMLADIEDLTESRILADSRLFAQKPLPPTLVRVMVHEQGEVQCVFWQKYFPLVPQRRRSLDLPTEARILQFSTHLSDGTSVTTIRVSDLPVPEEPPQIRVHFAPPDEPVTALLDRHRGNVDRVLSVWKAVRPLQIRTLDEFYDTLHHSQAQRNAYRRENGWISAREIQRLIGDREGSERAAQMLHREIQMLNARAEGGGR